MFSRCDVAQWPVLPAVNREDVRSSRTVAAMCPCPNWKRSPAGQPFQFGIRSGHGKEMPALRGDVQGASESCRWVQVLFPEVPRSGENVQGSRNADAGCDSIAGGGEIVDPRYQRQAWNSVRDGGSLRAEASSDKGGKICCSAQKVECVPWEGVATNEQGAPGEAGCNCLRVPRVHVVADTRGASCGWGQEEQRAGEPASVMSEPPQRHPEFSEQAKVGREARVAQLVEAPHPKCGATLQRQRRFDPDRGQNGEDPGSTPGGHTVAAHETAIRATQRGLLLMGATQRAPTPAGRGVRSRAYSGGVRIPGRPHGPVAPTGRAGGRRPPRWRFESVPVHECPRGAIWKTRTPQEREVKSSNLFAGTIGRCGQVDEGPGL